jgi:hypothetical protein
MAALFNILKKRQESLQCYIISSKPTILLTYWHDFITLYQNDVMKILSKKKKSYILFLNEFYNSKIAILEIKEQLEKLNSQNENVQFYFLANSEEENNNFSRFGVESIFCNRNCFLDEEQYKINLKVDKKYDAIYIALLLPDKRHALSEKIKSLLLIGSQDEKEVEYATKMKDLLKHAKWMENVSDNVVSKYINQAKVGLALSDVEGAPFASTEYLLCGIPQISTPNVGGRDVFFQNEYVQFVNPHEDAVLKGVEELAKATFDAMKIRFETIKTMKQHRVVFCNLIQEIYDKEGKRKKIKNEWSEIFTHKMGLGIDVPAKIYNERLLKSDTKFI